jgi:hypothetical protein
MALKEIVWEDGDWFNFTQVWEKWWAVVNVGMNLSVP